MESDRRVSGTHRYEAEVDQRRSKSPLHGLPETDWQGVSHQHFRPAGDLQADERDRRTTSGPQRVGINAPTLSARYVARRSIPPSPNQTHQRMACGSGRSTSVRNLGHRRGKFGAVRCYPGRWICERLRKRSGSDGRADYHPDTPTMEHYFADESLCMASHEAEGALCFFAT